MRYKYVLTKNELDKAYKDKSNHLAKDFKVILVSFSFHLWVNVFQIAFPFLFTTFYCEFFLNKFLCFYTEF